MYSWTVVTVWFEHGLLNYAFKKNTAEQQKYLLSLFDVICASLTDGSQRIPLRGLPMILFSAVCICWFDNPVISPSEGDSGSANTQQHTNSWTVTVAIVPPKQCLHFDVCDAWPAEGSFFNLSFSAQFPLSVFSSSFLLRFPAGKPAN